MYSPDIAEGALDATTNLALDEPSGLTDVQIGWNRVWRLIVIEVPLFVGLALVIYFKFQVTLTKKAWLMHATEVCFMIELALKLYFFSMFQDHAPSMLLGKNSRSAQNWIFDSIFMVSYAITGLPFYYITSLIVTLLVMDILAFFVGQDGILSITGADGIPWCDDHPSSCQMVARINATFYLVTLVFIGLGLCILSKLEDASNRRIFLQLSIVTVQQENLVRGTEERAKILAAQKRSQDALLHSIFPKAIARDLIANLKQPLQFSLLRDSLEGTDLRSSPSHEKGPDGIGRTLAEQHQVSTLDLPLSPSLPLFLSLSLSHTHSLLETDFCGAHLRPSGRDHRLHRHSGVYFHVPDLSAL